MRRSSPHVSQLDLQRLADLVCSTLPLPRHSGVYCLLVVATLLDLLTPELVESTADFIASCVLATYSHPSLPRAIASDCPLASRCQTFEGGFAASSSSVSSAFVSAFAPPPATSSPTMATFFPPATPLGEAHGGYTSCSVLSLSLLAANDVRPSPGKRQVDYKSLLRWSVMMQASAADGGGFKGRANKLVDGCYGWWVGGSFAVLESLVRPLTEAQALEGAKEDAMLYDRGAPPARGPAGCVRRTDPLFLPLAALSRAAGVHSASRATSQGRPRRQAAEVRPSAPSARPLQTQPADPCLARTLSGRPTFTIRPTTYPASRSPSTD